MPKKNIAVVLSLASTLYAGITVKAGGVLETVDVTANIPSPISGHLLARVIGIRWDDRSIPVAYRVNDSFAEVPNPLGEPVLPLRGRHRCLSGVVRCVEFAAGLVHRHADRRPGRQRWPGGL